METEKTMQLRVPVTVADKTYSEITLQEPTASQIAAAGENGGSAAKMDIDLISMVAAVPKAVINKLCARDFTDCRIFLAGFLRGDQETGAS